MKSDAMGNARGDVSQTTRRVEWVPSGERAYFLDCMLGELVPAFMALALTSLQNAGETHVETVAWEAFRVSNRAFFVVPAGMTVFQLAGCGNGVDGQLSAQAAGMYATAMALSHLAHRTGDDLPLYRYYLLRDFLDRHPEAAKLMLLLD